MKPEKNRKGRKIIPKLIAADQKQIQTHCHIGEILYLRPGVGLVAKELKNT